MLFEDLRVKPLPRRARVKPLPIGGILIGRDDPPADRQIEVSNLDAAGGRELAISLRAE
jgi:hypothetical protein